MYDSRGFEDISVLNNQCQRLLVQMRLTGSMRDLPFVWVLILENGNILLCTFDLCKHLEILVLLLRNESFYHFQQLYYIERLQYISVGFFVDRLRSVFNGGVPRDD